MGAQDHQAVQAEGFPLPSPAQAAALDGHCMSCTSLHFMLLLFSQLTQKSFSGKFLEEGK